MHCSACEWKCWGSVLWKFDRAGCNNRLSCAFLKLRVHVWFTTHVAFNLLSLCSFFHHSALCYLVGLWIWFLQSYTVCTIFRGVKYLSNMNRLFCKMNGCITSLPCHVKTILWVCDKNVWDIPTMWVWKTCTKGKKTKHVMVLLTDICTQTDMHALTPAFNTHLVHTK